MKKKFNTFLYFVVAAFAAFFIGASFYSRFCPVDRPVTASAEQAILKQAEDVSITVRYGGKKWRFSGAELMPASDIHTVILEVYHRNSYKTYKQKLDALERIREMGFSGEAAVRYLFPLLETKLKSIATSIDCDPVDARLSFDPGAPCFNIVREKTGLKVDINKVLAEAERQFVRSPKIDIVIKPDTVTTEIDAEYVKQGTFLRSRFSTDYSYSSDNRKHNVALALSRFNGRRIEPGEELSFNKTVGSRSEKHGFREAKIIKGGRFIDGLGGGVCQSSTTLYNAALLADMEIVRAGQHSLEVSYVEPSFDAMVNSGSSDLIVKNVTDFPMFIRTYATNERVFVEVYGKKMPYRIVRESVVTEKIPVEGTDEHMIDTEGKYLDKVKYKGEKAVVQTRKDGTKSEGYLKFYDFSGSLIERRLIRKNTYLPQRALIVEGNLPPPPENPPLP